MSMAGINVSHHRRQVPPHRGREDGPAWQFAAAGLCASLVGLGLARFAYTPGIVPLVLGRIHEVLPHDNSSQRAAWAQATTTFALFQAAGAYGLSYLFEPTGGDYAVLFVIGAGAVVISLAMDLVTALIIGRERKPSGA